MPHLNRTTHPTGPLPEHDHNVLGAYRAEEVFRARLEEQEIRLALEGRTKLTRQATAMLRDQYAESTDTRASKRRRQDREEERELRETFGIDPDSDDSAEKEEMSSSGASDDSVYEDEGGPSTEEDLDDEESTADADISDKEMPLKSGSDEVKITEQPNLHRISGRKKESGVATSLVWFYGFKTLFDSWEEFDEAFDEFQRVSFQQFSKRTSTSVATRNKQIVRTTEERRAGGKKSRKEVILVPEKWETYSKTLVCTHGQPYEPRGVGKRNHRKVRDTKCSARVNVCVTATARGRWVLRANATGDHNHDLNRHLWESYAENRVVTDSRLKNDVVVMHKAGANAYGILQYLRERTGKKTILRDVHNMVQRHKQQEQAGFSDAQRAFAVLEEFCRQNDANSAEVVLDTETNIARIATFQTARMKRLFKAFPEVVMVDTTHNTNANRYKLFSFVVHDVFGKGQYVHHSLVDSEHKDNLRRVVEIFKENNPDWTKVQVVMSDKAVHEKDVLHEMLPQARQLLCQWHVITWLKKQTARLAKPVKKEVKALMRLLVYAGSPQEYDDAKGAMLQKLGGDASHELYKTFMENWDNSQDEWVSYRRGNVPHLTNNTNNRIESKWGKLKDIINESFSIDQLLSTLITLQEYSEEQYLKEYHRVGSRPARICEDPELSRLGLQLSAFAFDLVSKQHTLATGETVDYDVELGENGRALVRSSRTGSRHVVNTQTCACDCIFMKTCLLPCRHVMHVRSVGNYESVIPPLRCFPTRWIVQSRENDISTGEVPCGGLKQSSCAPLAKHRALSNFAMYCEAKALMEKIVDRMALQSTPTFRVALTWLDDFYEALNSGKVVTFADSEVAVFPGLSQVSSIGGARLSQMSFADVITNAPGDDITIPVVKNISTAKVVENANSSANTTCEVDEAVDAPTRSSTRTSSSVEVQVSPHEKSETKPIATKTTPNNTKREGTSAKDTETFTWSFAKRPVISGMTKAQRKQAQAKQDREIARNVAAQYRSGTVSKLVTFTDVATLLDGPYSYFNAKAMVDALELPAVEISGSLSVRQRSAGQDIPVVEAIPQLPKIIAAIDAIRLKQDIDLLAYWSDFGYATFDQLDAMATLVEARTRFGLVMQTIKWIENVEWNVADLRKPFTDTSHVTKNEHIGYVETLNLSVNRVPGEVVGGHQLLDFRSNLWLHTTSILVSLMALRDEYVDVGIISPSFHDFVLLDQQRRTAGGFGAGNPKYKRVMCCFNVDRHWVAFMVDRNDDTGATCFMFDPLQNKRNYQVIEKSVRRVIEPLLQLEGMLSYEKVEWCKQQDGSSCGVWCIAVLELILSDSTWDDCLYKLVPYLRMRLLYKAIAFVGKDSAYER